METDHVGAGSYYLPTEPEDQKLARKSERAKALEEHSILKQVVRNLEERIAFLTTIDSIEVKPETDPQKFMVALQAAKATRAALIHELETIKSILDSAGVKDV